MQETEKKKSINKGVLLLITFFFGGIGAHKFYICKYWQGTIYLLFCWTGIPFIISLFEFIIYIFKSQKELNEKYKRARYSLVLSAICAGILILYVSIAIFASIPQFLAFRKISYRKTLESDLKALKSLEVAHHVETGRYTVNIEELDFKPSSSAINVEIVNVNENCFVAKGTHNLINEEVTIDCNGFIK